MIYAKFLETRINYELICLETLQKSHLVANFSSIEAVSRLSLRNPERHVRKHPSGQFFLPSPTSTNKKFA